MTSGVPVIKSTGETVSNGEMGSNCQLAAREIQSSLECINHVLGCLYHR
jgi:hypothetical protein